MIEKTRKPGNDPRKVETAGDSPLMVHIGESGSIPEIRTGIGGKGKQIKGESMEPTIKSDDQNKTFTTPLITPEKNHSSNTSLIHKANVQGTTQDTREEVQGARTQREHAKEPLELNPTSSKKGAAEPPDKTKKTQ